MLRITLFLAAITITLSCLGHDEKGCGMWNHCCKSFGNSPLKCDHHYGENKCVCKCHHCDCKHGLAEGYNSTLLNYTATLLEGEDEEEIVALA